MSAEPGSQSRKAQNASKWGKPVFTVDEFYGWLSGRQAQTSNAEQTAEVHVVAVPRTPPRAAKTLLDGPGRDQEDREEGGRRTGTATPRGGHAGRGSAQVPVVPRPEAPTHVPSVSPLPSPVASAPLPAVVAPARSHTSTVLPVLPPPSTPAKHPEPTGSGRTRPVHPAMGFHLRMLVSILALILGGPLIGLVLTMISGNLLDAGVLVIFTCWLVSEVLVPVWIVRGVRRSTHRKEGLPRQVSGARIPRPDR